MEMGGHNIFLQGLDVILSFEILSMSYLNFIALIYYFLGRVPLFIYSLTSFAAIVSILFMWKLSYLIYKDKKAAFYSCLIFLEDKIIPVIISTAPIK